MTDQASNISDYETGKMQSMTCFLSEEYKTLRKEIDIYHSHQQGFLYFIIYLFTTMILVFASLASFASQSQAKIEKFSIIFLLFPLIYTVILFLYTDRTFRIIRIADYLHNFLRDKVNKFVEQDVFQWESYKRNTKIVNRKLATLLDRIRGWIFIIPSIVAIFFFWSLLELSKWGIREIIFLGMDCISVTISTILIHITDDETIGIESKAALISDGNDH